jgi:hypothetical protein
VEKEYVARQCDLTAHFPKLEPVPAVPLPPAFDAACKRCGEQMERMPVICRTRQRPFAIFQCQSPGCKVQLLLFDAPTSPLLIWSDSFNYAVKFSEMIDDRIADRERKRELRELHYKKPPD